MSATAARATNNGHARRAPTRPRALPQPTDAGPQSLDAALLEFSKRAPKLVRDAIGQVQSRTYRYVTLDGVLDTVMPLLVELDLLWKAWPTTDENGQPALRYRMTHVPSGDQDEDVMPLMCANADPQGQGSALTYARRYALLAYLNLAPGEDDDGTAASIPAAATGAPVTHPAAAAAPQPSARQAAGGDRPASAKQRSMLRAKADAVGLKAAEFANIVLAANGEPARDWDDNAADRWLGRALDRLAAKRVDAVILGIERSQA